MFVYLSGDKQAKAPSHIVYISPAADLEGEEVPKDWLDDGKPKLFHVEFKFGRAEVPSNIGKYLISRGIAGRTALIIPDGVKAA